MSEEYFGMSTDPTQMNPTKEIKKWLFHNGQKYLNVIKDQQKIIGYTFMIPTSKKNMKLFLKEAITEAELFKELLITKEKNTQPEALYLCAAIIKEPYQRKGLALQGYLQLLKPYQQTNIPLYTWPFNNKGRKLVQKIGILTGLIITERKKSSS